MVLDGEYGRFGFELREVEFKSVTKGVGSLGLKRDAQMGGRGSDNGGVESAIRSGSAALQPQALPVGPQCSRFVGVDTQGSRLCDRSQRRFQESGPSVWLLAAPFKSNADRIGRAIKWSGRQKEGSRRKNRQSRCEPPKYPQRAVGNSPYAHASPDSLIRETEAVSSRNRVGIVAGAQQSTRQSMANAAGKRKSGRCGKGQAEKERCQRKRGRIISLAGPRQRSIFRLQAASPLDAKWEI